MSGDNNVRCFIAAAVAGNIAMQVRNATRSITDDPSWRLTDPEQWHITALFLGNVRGDRLQGIQEQVASVASSVHAFELGSGRLVTMPDKDPNMLWLRFDPHPELTSLHLALAHTLNIDPSAHTPYWPHITLARSSGNATAIDQGPVVLDRFRFSLLTLYRSIPGPDGSIHSALMTWPLS